MFNYYKTILLYTDKIYLIFISQKKQLFATINQKSANNIWGNIIYGTFCISASSYTLHTQKRIQCMIELTR